MEPICDDLHAADFTFTPQNLHVPWLEMNMSHATMSCTVPYRSNTLAFEDIFIKLLKKNLKRPTKKVHYYWLPPAALGSLEMEFPWLRLPTAF